MYASVSLLRIVDVRLSVTEKTELVLHGQLLIRMRNRLTEKRVQQVSAQQVSAQQVSANFARPSVF